MFVGNKFMNKKSNIKILIALIHNNNKTRNEYIWPKLRELKRELSKDVQIQIIEVSKEPQVLPNNTLTTLVIKLSYWKIEREWVRYRELRPRSFVLDIAAAIRLLVLTFIHRKRENIRTVNDSFVTDKHIRAWNVFFEMEYDFLICFEDDAVFHNNSIQILKIFLREIQKNKKNPVYLDLGGGCDYKTLGMDKLEYKRDKYRRYYRKPGTNTVCAYMISRISVQAVLQYLLRHPQLRLIAPDWLLIKFFIDSFTKYKHICYHAAPSIFSHGSITGVYPSLHLKN
jgi:hypothetical protein